MRAAAYVRPNASVFDKLNGMLILLSGHLM
jgi:hypothetical protein